MKVKTASLGRPFAFAGFRVAYRRRLLPLLDEDELLPPEDEVPLLRDEEGAE